MCKPSKKELNVMIITISLTEQRAWSSGLGKAVIFVVTWQSMGAVVKQRWAWLFMAEICFLIKYMPYAVHYLANHQAAAGAGPVGKRRAQSEELYNRLTFIIWTRSYGKN
jgi:hypothetical protein